jgi:vacuolar-type H+-ATPase subunit I/STV1
MEGLLRMRYLFLLMGFFSIFTGFLYNEFFAIPMQVMGDSCYEDEIKIIGTSPTYGYARRADAFTVKNGNLSDLN